MINRVKVNSSKSAQEQKLHTRVQNICMLIWGLSLGRRSVHLLQGEEMLRTYYFHSRKWFKIVLFRILAPQDKRKLIQSDIKELRPLLHGIDSLHREVFTMHV